MEWFVSYWIVWGLAAATMVYASWKYRVIGFLLIAIAVFGLPWVVRPVKEMLVRWYESGSYPGERFHGQVLLSDVISTFNLAILILKYGLVCIGTINIMRHLRNRRGLPGRPEEAAPAEAAAGPGPVDPEGAR